MKISVAKFGVAVVAMLGFAVPAQAAGRFYAKCYVESVPSMDEGGGGAWVTGSATSTPSSDAYLTEDSSEDNGLSAGNSRNLSFYAYRPDDSTTFEFLGWNKDKTSTTSTISETTILGYRYVTHQITATSTKESAPTTDRIYAHYHVHHKAYVKNTDGVTIDYKCINTASTCKNSCGSSSATLNAPNKNYDGVAYAATITGDQNATIEYYQGATKISAPVNAGTYKAKMIYGDQSVTKEFTIAAIAIDPITLNKTELFYTGSQQSVSVTAVTAAGGAVTLTSADYSITGNTGAGDPAADTQYTVTVTATNPNFTGTKTANWVIRGHSHGFSCKVSEGRLSVACTNDNCTLPDGTSLEIICTGAGKAYDGSPLTATIKDNTASPATFESFTGGSRDAQVTWDDSTANVGNHKATFFATVEGRQYEISKTFTIAPLDISSSAVVTLSATDFKYSGSERTVSIASVKSGDMDVTYDEAIDSKRTATAIGTYTVKINAKGNFTGTATTTWKISDYSGSFGDSALATSASGCAVSGSTVEVTDSTSLKYVEPDSWRLSAVLTWPRTFPNISTSQDDSNVLYIDEEHAIIEALDDSTSLDIKVREYKVPVTGTLLASHSYIDTLTWTVDVTLDDITNAVANGEQSLDYLLYVGAQSWTHYPDGISMTSYVMTLPLEDIVLMDDQGHQVYPEPDHKHACEYVADGAKLLATCTNETGECAFPDGKAAIELTVSGLSEGVAPTVSISNKVDFLAAVNLTETVVTLGEITITRTTNDGADRDNWYAGEYVAKCVVAIAGDGYRTIEKPFTIAAPSGGYSSGWVVVSRNVRYATWYEALSAAATVDTIRYLDGDRDFKTHDFSIDGKTLTVDFNGSSLTYTGGIEDMTISNTGTGSLTLQNVTLVQPKYALVSFQISSKGSIVFGSGVQTVNQATNSDRYLTITASDGTLVVTNGLYQNSFSGSYKLRGGKYQSEFGEPTADTEAGYIVRVISGDYDREIVAHSHQYSFTAGESVITAVCVGVDHEYCGYGSTTMTMSTPIKSEDGSPYKPTLQYTEGFPTSEVSVTYWDGTTQIEAPTTEGTYTVKLSAGSASIEQQFQIIHTHAFEYVADQDNVKISVSCTAKDDCDYYLNPRSVSLAVGDGVYDGEAQALATVITNTVDFPTEVSLYYSCGGLPVNAGSYKVTMETGGKSVTNTVIIEKRDITGGELTLSSTSLPYTGAAQSVKIENVKPPLTTGLSATYDVDGSSVQSATDIGTYWVTVTGNGNYTGILSNSWQITNYSGAMESVEPATASLGSVDGTTLTVTNSVSLEYDPVKKTWYAGLKLTWGMKVTEFTIRDYAYVVYTRPDMARITAGGTTFTGNDNGDYAGGTISNKLTTATYWKNLLNDKDYTYLDTTLWRVEVTPELLEAARPAGEFTATMYAGALPFSESDNTQYSLGTEFKTYKIVIPIDDSLKLINDTNNQVYPIPSHIHRCEYATDGAVLTAKCTNDVGDCELTDRKISLELTVTGGADGVAPTIAISNKVEFLAEINLVENVVSIGDISVVRLTNDQAAYDKWYVGEYRATCPVTIAGLGVQTMTNLFSIVKPDAGYNSGWTVGSRDIRYDTWDEALIAATDGDTIYYRDGDRDFKTHEFSVGSKSLTIDFNGAKLTRSDELGDMTIKNSGSGSLSFQNVTLVQPKGFLVSFQISAQGEIVFGTGVQTVNQATNPDRYLKITVSDGSLIVTNGLYQNSFASSDNGSYKLRGGKYKSTYGEPTADTDAGYIVRVISGDYDREIVHHEHFYEYSAETNVITAVCTTNDHEYCGFGTQTATLLAPDVSENGSAYSQASIEYSDTFPSKTGTITYWDGETQISAPSDVGVYTAKVTIAGATAVKEFKINHVHKFEYDADEMNGTITARCTKKDDCDYNLNKRIVTLNVANGTYTGFAQDLATVVTNTVDYPTNVVLTYSCAGKPVNAGDYTATMAAGDKSVTTNFSIAKASMSATAITLSAESLYYTGATQTVSVSSVKLGDYTLIEGIDYTNAVSSVLKSAGSGASNMTFEVTLVGRGNFSDDTQNATWTIVAPTRDFDSVDKYGETGGTLSGSTLTMEGSNWVYFTAADAPDGSGVAGWYAGIQLTWPVDERVFTQFTRDEAALHTLSTQPGEQFWGNDLSGAVGLSAYTASAFISEVKYIKYTYWWTRLTPADAENCEGAAVERLMTACGLRWSKSGSVYKDDNGVREITCSVVQPTNNLVLTVPADITHDIGATKLVKSSLKLGVNAKVTTTVEQAKGKIFTEEEGFAVVHNENSGTWTYSCVPLVKLNPDDMTGVDAKVYYDGDEISGPAPFMVPTNETVTVVYTAKTGYYFADGTTVRSNEVVAASNPTQDTCETIYPQHECHGAAFTIRIGDFAALTNLLAKGGNGYLVADVQIPSQDDCLINAGAPIKLCLNGYHLSDYPGAYSECHGSIMANTSLEVFSCDRSARTERFWKRYDVEGATAWTNVASLTDADYVTTGGVCSVELTTGWTEESTLRIDGVNLVGVMGSAVLADNSKEHICTLTNCLVACNALQSHSYAVRTMGNIDVYGCRFELNGGAADLFLNGGCTFSYLDDELGEGGACICRIVNSTFAGGSTRAVRSEYVEYDVLVENSVITGYEQGIVPGSGTRLIFGGETIVTNNCDSEGFVCNVRYRDDETTPIDILDENPPHGSAMIGVRFLAWDDGADKLVSTSGVFSVSNDINCAAYFASDDYRYAVIHNIDRKLEIEGWVSFEFHDSVNYIDEPLVVRNFEVEKLLNYIDQMNEVDELYDMQMNFIDVGELRGFTVPAGANISSWGGDYYVDCPAGVEIVGRGVFTNGTWAAIFGDGVMRLGDGVVAYVSPVEGWEYDTSVGVYCNAVIDGKVTIGREVDEFAPACATAELLFEGAVSFEGDGCIELLPYGAVLSVQRLDAANFTLPDGYEVFEYRDNSRYEDVGGVWTYVAKLGAAAELNVGGVIVTNILDTALALSNNVRFVSSDADMAAWLNQSRKVDDYQKLFVCKVTSSDGIIFNIAAQLTDAAKQEIIAACSAAAERIIKDSNARRMGAVEVETKPGMFYAVFSCDTPGGTYVRDGEWTWGYGTKATLRFKPTTFRENRFYKVEANTDRLQ